MPDIAAIGAVLSSIKTATEIAKLLKESDLSLERADLKLRLAELVSALADAKSELVDVQEKIAEKDRELSALRDAFESKDSLVRVNDGYYRTNAEGQPKGPAYCVHCWEDNHVQRQLCADPKDRLSLVMCVSCGQKYSALHAYLMQ